MNFKGYQVSINKEKFRKSSFKEKLEFLKIFFSEQSKYIYRKKKDYWIGWVDVHTQDISCTDEQGNRVSKLYEVNIYAGKNGNGQTFSGVSKETCQQIVEEWESSDKKLYGLHLSLGCGISQQYDFTKKQKDMLVAQLKPLLEREWYEQEQEDDDTWGEGK